MSSFASGEVSGALHIDDTPNALSKFDVILCDTCSLTDNANFDRTESRKSKTAQNRCRALFLYYEKVPYLGFLRGNSLGQTGSENVGAIQPTLLLLGLRESNFAVQLVVEMQIFPRNAQEATTKLL